MAYQCLCFLQTSVDSFTIDDTKSDDIVSMTITYLRENLDKQCTVEELAQHINLSPYYFAHLFLKKTGMSLIEYSATSKINYAKSILKTTKSITEITETLGYSFQCQLY